jgi:hypothetical protein
MPIEKRCQKKELDVQVEMKPSMKNVDRSSEDIPV